MRIITALLLFLLLLPGARAAGADDAKALARGRALSTLFLESKTDELWAQMTPTLQQALGSPAKLGEFRAQVRAQLGEETQVVEEQVQDTSGVSVYLRKSQWSKVPQRILMQWAVDGDDHVAGFFVRPDQLAVTPAPTKFLDYQTKAKLQLPVDGEWLVFWGGRTPEQNYHVMDSGQRFAYDLLVVREGSSHRGEGGELTDYYSWNQPIRAPADGVVGEVVDGLPDQRPGSTDPAHPPGNHVVLDLGNGEYALLAHLRQGSVRVKPGDRVRAGDELGRCGNSGNTSEPHLHFHLQNALRFGAGEGLPAFFNDYLADGKPVARGEPVKGQHIQRE